MKKLSIMTITHNLQVNWSSERPHNIVLDAIMPTRLAYVECGSIDEKLHTAMEIYAGLLDRSTNEHMPKINMGYMVHCLDVLDIEDLHHMEAVFINSFHQLSDYLEKRIQYEQQLLQTQRAQQLVDTMPSAADTNGASEVAGCQAAALVENAEMYIYAPLPTVPIPPHAHDAATQKTPTTTAHIISDSLFNLYRACRLYPFSLLHHVQAALLRAKQKEQLLQTVADIAYYPQYLRLIKTSRLQSLLQEIQHRFNVYEDYICMRERVQIITTNIAVHNELAAIGLTLQDLEE